MPPLLAVLAAVVTLTAAPGEVAASKPDHRQLVELTTEIGSRQFGQPGNRALGDRIAARFKQAVERGNANWPDRVAEADRLWALADRANEEVFTARKKLERETREGGVEGSPWYVRFTLEKPAITIVVFVVLLILTIASWRGQKRTSLMYMAALWGLIAIALPIAAVIVETDAERITRQGEDTDTDLVTRELLVQDVRDAARKAVEADIQAARGLRKLWLEGRITAPSAAFVPGETWLRTGNGRKVRLYQMSPNLVEPANLPDGLFEGNLLYAGRGGPEDIGPIADRLNAVDKASAVLLDFASARRWLDAVRYGAAVVILIEPPPDAAMTRGEASQKFSDAPLSIPRFYIRRKDLAAAFGTDWKTALAANPKITIDQPKTGRWRHEELAIDWLFVPGTAQEKPPGTKIEKDPARQLVHLQTYRDSNSIVAELSPGAGSASNVALMLRLLDRFERQRPLRPVLISIVNNHANAMQGEAEFAYFAFGDAGAVHDELDWLEEQLAHERFAYETYVEPTANSVAILRTQVATVAGKKIKTKQPVMDRLTRQRNVISERRAGLVLKLGDLSEEDTAREGNRSEVEQLGIQLYRVQRLMQVFNQFGQKTEFGALDGDEMKLLVSTFEQIRRKADRDIGALSRARRAIMENLSIRRQLRYLTDRDEQISTEADYRTLFEKQFRPLPATIGICLDLSLGTDGVGFFHVGHMQSILSADAAVRALDLGKETVSVAQELAARTGSPNLLVDTITNNRSITWPAHLGGRFALGSSAMHRYWQCGLTLTSVQDHRLHAFTPLDTADRIDPDRYRRVMTFAEAYLPALIDEPELGAWPREAGRTKSVMAVELSLRLQDRLSTDVPKQTVANALVVAAQGPNNFPENYAMFGQVRPHLVVLTDERGSATLRGSNMTANQAFLYDDAYRNVLCTRDMGEGERQFQNNIGATPGDYFDEIKFALSELRKVDLVGLTSPLTMAPLPGLRVLDARQNSTPRHWGLVGITQSTLGADARRTSAATRPPASRDGTACLFVEPGTFFKLRLGSAVALNITQNNPDKGEGFASDIGMLPDVTRISFRDMQKLTERRLKLLKEKGVKESMAGEFNDRARRVIEASEDPPPQAPQLDDLSRAEEAVGWAYRAYTRGRGIINDLIVAVVVFMALVIPFCFFLMKLITPFTEVTRQLVMFGLIFVAMVALLYFVHPAFSVADTPVVVVIAFIILGLAVYVSMILISRFNGSMMQVVEQALQSESVEASQSRMMEAAFLVGVNNMKRRRIRTSLTCATIVLVTFTMLSVISVGQDVDPAMVRLKSEASYDGFVFTQPGMSQISNLQMDRLRARYSRGAVTVARAWGVRGNINQALPIEISRAPEEGEEHKPLPVPALEAEVLLGLDEAEKDFVRPLPIAAGRWFDGHSPEMLLSVRAAALLGIRKSNFEETDLVVLGIKLKLVGLLDDEMLFAIQDLGKTTILPLKVDMSPQQANQAAERELDLAKDLGAGTVALDAAGGEIPGARPVDPINIAFMPIDLVRSLGLARYRSLSVKFLPDPGLSKSPGQRAWDEANRLIRFQHQRDIVGLTEPVTRDYHTESKLNPGEYALTSSTSTQVGGVLKAAIPTILAATIILNTMLGSVIERRREVGIYNAIGLNPGHVMIFFLAESLVFGMVGSVAGYLIGQALSILVTRFELVNLNLNYSSTAVIVVIFLTIATVLISTIYPALMAARAAVPSGQRRWSLPRPNGDQIHIDFPFSYDAERVMGVCAYLHEFMQQNSEASTGKFLARIGPVGLVPAPGETDGEGVKHETAFALIYDIAPAPFDLGVNQKMEVYASYNARVRSHMLAVHLTRLSGEHSNWVAVNQPFLESLRKRLLAWRSQPAEMQNNYHTKGAQMFRGAALLPITSEGRA